MKPYGKKPSLAEVSVKASKASSASDEDDSYDAALDELADLLGVPAGKRESFASAFAAAVMGCK